MIDAWSVDDDLWLRRTSVICQVGRGEATDRDLLLRVVEANLDDRHVLAAQGDRLGAPRLRADRPGLGVGVVDELGERLSGPVAARGDQAPAERLTPLVGAGRHMARSRA